MTFRALAFLTIFSFLACSGSEPPAQPAVDQPKPGEIGMAELGQLSDQMRHEAAEPTDAGLLRVIALASHPDYLVRIQAMKALGTEHYRNTPGGAAALKHAVNDEHWLVRSFAIKALAKRPDTGSLEVLEARLEIEQHERVQKYLRESIQHLREAKVQ